MVLQPPLPLQEFLPLQPASPVLQPPAPLQSFLPLQSCLSLSSRVRPMVPAFSTTIFLALVSCELPASVEVVVEARLVEPAIKPPRAALATIMLIFVVVFMVLSFPRFPGFPDSSGVSVSVAPARGRRFK